MILKRDYYEVCVDKTSKMQQRLRKHTENWQRNIIRTVMREMLRQQSILRK